MEIVALRPIQAGDEILHSCKSFHVPESRIRSLTYFARSFLSSNHNTYNYLLTC